MVVDDVPESSQNTAAPEEVDEDELDEWAAEQELLEGLNPEDIFSLSDMDEPPDGVGEDEDDDEDMLWRAVDKGKGRAVAAPDADVEMDF